MNHIDEEWERLTKEVPAGKLIDTCPWLIKKLKEKEVNEFGDLVITINKEELEKIVKELEISL